MEAPIFLKIKNSIARRQINNIISQDVRDAKTLGVRATPQFFVNGKPLANFGYKQLVQSVEEAIALVY